MDKKIDVKSVGIGEAGYPVLLREIPDPPQVLFYAGNLGVLDKICVGIVGTRRASTYGEGQAFEIARGLSRQGICVVSGLAYGVDTAAHKGALEGDGGTVAVLAQGLPEIGPAGNLGLAMQILNRGGLLLSEKTPGMPVQKHEYLFRNRIISGVSKGVLIVEAGWKSGARNTANHAIEQNREVMALPGRVTDELSVATNYLISQGAKLVTGARDVVEGLGLLWQEDFGVNLEGVEKVVYSFLKSQPMTGAELGEHFSGQLKMLYSVLGSLELRGLIKRGSDLRYFALGSEEFRIE